MPEQTLPFKMTFSRGGRFVIGTSWGSGTHTTGICQKNEYYIWIIDLLCMKCPSLEHIFPGVATTLSLVVWGPSPPILILGQIFMVGSGMTGAQKSTYCFYRHHHNSLPKRQKNSKNRLQFLNLNSYTKYYFYKVGPFLDYSNIQLAVHLNFNFSIFILWSKITILNLHL